MVAALVVITALYCWGLGWMAWGFFRAGGTVGWGLGIGVGIITVLTVWVIWREVLFGLASARLAREYEQLLSSDGGADENAVPAEHAASAQAEQAETDADPAALKKQAARAEFEQARSALENGREDDWTAWYRLALAYEALRDRRDARMAVRRAISLHRASR